MHFAYLLLRENQMSSEAERLTKQARAYWLMAERAIKRKERGYYLTLAACLLERAARLREKCGAVSDCVPVNTATVIKFPIVGMPPIDAA